MYLAARLARFARQWLKERGLSCMALSVGFIYYKATSKRTKRAR